MSQKYSDKLYSKCCKIFKAYLTSKPCSYYPALKLLLLIFFNVLYVCDTNLYHINRPLISNKVNKAFLFVIDICVSHCANELE